MAALRKVFVETTVVSVLVARRSKDLQIVSQQLFTRSWWRRRNDFQLFASTAVRNEAVMGDAREAAKRLAVLHTMVPLVVSAEAETMAGELLARGILPRKAQIDALHLATAAVHKMDLLLSWNFKHLVNPDILRQVYVWAAENKYNVPVICTPEALLRTYYAT
jgi:hypothetical protein